MSVMILVVAAVALVPQPQQATFAGGSVPAAQIRYVFDATLPKEGYRLSVSKSGVKVWASTEAGRFYARKTLEQLERKGKYPICEIRDEPAYAWRGFMIDEARHFFGKEAIKKVIDEMSRLKMNRFHWHLTDDQGWRIGLKKYPELMEYGAVRASSPVKGPKWAREYDGEPYGPFFYTEEDLREVVAYAAARHIEIVPEIDVPGHCQGLLAGYPWMLCEGEQLRPRMARNNWWLAGIRTLCIGNDEAIRQVEGILDEVMKIFPGDYIHFGGDECPDRYWAKCPKCRARMAKEGFKKAHELQGWFSRHMAEYLVAKGRKPIGWDEVLAGDPPKSCAIMSWRGARGGINAARAGHFAVLAPNTYCNLNRWDGNCTFDAFNVNAPIGGGVGQTMDVVYSFDPVKDVPEEARTFVLGGQSCHWSEYVFSPQELEYRLFPRVGALAEALWTAPRTRDYRAFRPRIDAVRARQVARGVNAAPIVDLPKLSLDGTWGLSLEWGADRVSFKVPKAEKSGQRLDALVRTGPGTYAYRAGEPVPFAPPLPRVGTGEELAGTVWVPSGATGLTDDNLYPRLSGRFWRPQCRWNEPLARGNCPKAVQKLRKGEKCRVLVWGDEALARELPEGRRWTGRFAARLKEIYPKADVELTVRADSGATNERAAKVVEAKPDLVVSAFVSDTFVPQDGSQTPLQAAEALYREYAAIAATFKAGGIEWIVCVPHYARPDLMGKATVKACADDPRPVCKILRRLSGTCKVALADAASYWSNLAARGYPHTVLLSDGKSRLTEEGAKYYAWALDDLFRDGEPWQTCE